MKRLQKIHAGLARLRLYRSTVRFGIMGSTVLSTLLWALAAAFALDFAIRMDPLSRGIVLVALIGVAVWTVIRHLLPAVNIHESDTALAVLVDRRHSMHSDLVAAIQFDDEGRPQYGSTNLREAVIEQTRRQAAGLTFLAGFSRKEFLRRLLVFLITVAICLPLAVIYSGHTTAFLNRLLLGRARYPTRTIIKEIVSPGETSPYAHPVTFAVRGAVREGEMPESGQVQIEAVTTGLETTVDLVRDKEDPSLYKGTLNRVLDDLHYVIYLGDAESDVQTLTLIPLPLAELTMKVVPPDYARRKVPPQPKNRRQAIVLEGSEVIPIATADKKLRSATLTFEKDKQKISLDRHGKQFVLDSKTKLPSKVTKNPLSSVTETVRFEIQVVDTDELSPETPIKGVVHVSVDLPPRVALAAYSQFVVPKAAPQVMFKAVDDYALDRLVLHRTIVHAEGKETPLEPITFKVAEHKAVYAGSYTLRLAELKVDGKAVTLQKGEQVVLAVEAVDFRGPMESKSRQSEKWVFEVTDQAGVLGAMDRLDEQMDKKLDEILRAQLEAGK